jgi:hypothetical protein
MEKEEQGKNSYREEFVHFNEAKKLKIVPFIKRTLDKGIKCVFFCKGFEKMI